MPGGSAAFSLKIICSEGLTSVRIGVVWGLHKHGGPAKKDQGPGRSPGEASRTERHYTMITAADIFEIDRFMLRRAISGKVIRVKEYPLSDNDQSVAGRDRVVAQGLAVMDENDPGRVLPTDLAVELLG